MCRLRLWATVAPPRDREETRDDERVLSGILIAGLIVLDAMIVSIVYHRYLTHRSLEVNRLVARAATLVLQGLAFAPPLTWVSAHLYHHAHTDSADDPYSPRVQGFWRVLLLTPLLVIRWRKRQGPAVVARLTRGLPDRGFYAVCDRGWFCLFISVAFAAGFLLLLGWRGLLIYALQLAGIRIMGGWINAGAHTVGARPHDNSGVNRRGPIPWLLNLAMAGEWLHNHHHHAPGSPNFGLAGELDSGYLASRVLAACRLASIRRSALAVGFAPQQTP